MSDQRASILSLLGGELPPSRPAFSGLVHLTVEGLASAGLEFSQIHQDADRMARAAASTFKSTGLPSAAVPFDLCIEAEALGATVSFPGGGSVEFPRVRKPAYLSPETLVESLRSRTRPRDFPSLGRIPLVCQAITQLKREIGGEAAISAILAGPFTVLSALAGRSALFIDMKRQPELIREALFRLASFIAQAGQAYRDAGGDFLTIHEMGGSPDLLGPKRFAEFVLPALSELLDALPKPRVLAVCGNLDSVSLLLETAGADALSIDQSNHIGRLRAMLPRALLFGNLDPVQLLSHATSEQVQDAARMALKDGADAVWPGCDLVPTTPIENIRALVA
jgi:[methyl-Co(III) methanol-specific corrinoid protein]:coenzyme M methyltransferase